MVSKWKLQILSVLLIVVVMALALSAFTVAAQAPSWGGGGLVVSGFGDFFGVIVRFFALIFGL